VHPIKAYGGMDGPACFAPTPLDGAEFFDDLGSYLEHDAVAAVGAFAGGKHGGEGFSAAGATVGGLHACYWGGAIGASEFLSTAGALECHSKPSLKGIIQLL